MPPKVEVLPQVIHYPSSDGKPMAESTLQYQAIVLLQGNIEAMFGEEDEVAVLADNLWYPVQGQPSICTAPDVMVIFGRPRGPRRAYLQWKEGGIAPQVVFEVLSHSNTLRELLDKHTFYEKYGVEEYYIYDPHEAPKLEGWRRVEGRFRPIDAMSGHVSQRLGIRFDMSRGDLDVYSPNGERFFPFMEIVRRRKIAEEDAARALQEAEQSRQQAEAERQRAERLAARLRDLGIDPDAA